MGWGAVDGRQGYRVSYSDVNDLQNASTFDVPSNTASLSNLTPGTKNYVWVQTICSETSISDPRLDSFYTELACYSIIDLEQTGSTFNAASFSWNFTEQGNARTAVYAVVHDLTDPIPQNCMKRRTAARNTARSSPRSRRRQRYRAGKH